MKTYLSSFVLPSDEKEMEYCWGHYNRSCPYPFGMFPKRMLSQIYFAPITVFYGGNGSGKSTLLNLIAEKTGLRRESVTYQPDSFYDYAKDLCSFSLSDEWGEDGMLPHGSRIITSDDVFSGILGRREESHAIAERRREEEEHYRLLKDANTRPVFRDWATDRETLDEILEARGKKRGAYLRDRAGEIPRAYSNGENALRLFDEAFSSDALYLLDEPENSLSTEYQEKLAALILHCARYSGCQFVICTHSPFLLAIESAKIYDLDAYPVQTREWYELENVLRLAALFFRNQSCFES